MERILHGSITGGAGQLLWLSLALKTLHCSNDTRVPTCLILDSTPGAFRYPDLQLVLSLSLTGFSRIVGAAAAPILYTALKAASVVCGRPELHDFIRGGLHNPKIFPWMDSTTPRLYFYSDADKLSSADAVRSHITAGKEIGLNIREERFLESPHVSHSRVDPDRYWGAVHSLWGDAVRSKL
jgi:hypothetical protein